MRDGRALSHETLEAMRFRAIETYRGGQSITGIANLYGLHRESVSRWISRWKRGGKKVLKSRVSSGRPHKIDCLRHGRAILKIVKQPADRFGYEHPLWNCQRLRKTVARQLRIRVSVPTLWRALRQLKLSCQKPERRAVEQDPKAGELWLRQEWPKIKRLARRRKAIIFFEDEATVRLTPTVGRTWAPIGKTPIVRVTGKRASVGVMSAISPKGRLYFSIPPERVNALIFIQFLRGLLQAYPRRRIVVIADRGSAHTAKKVKAFVEQQKRLTLFYLPPYSPELNPDEETWNHLKHQELKAHQARDRKGLRRRTHVAMRRISKRPELIRSFFKRSGVI